MDGIAGPASRFETVVPNGGGLVRKEDDSGLIVRFHLQPRLLVAKSKAAGKDIYADAEFCEIRVKGQPAQVVDELVTPEHCQKYPVAYAAFKAQKEMPVVGIPIDQLPGIGSSMVQKLKLIGVRSIEDMANLTDAGLQAVGQGGRAMQSTAKSYVKQKPIQVVELEEKIVVLEREKVEFQGQLKEMNERLRAVENRKTRKET